MSQVRLHILGRAVPPIGSFDKWPAQILPIGTQGAIGSTVAGAAVRVYRDEPGRDMGARWAGSVEIGWNFESDPHNLPFESPGGDGIGESEPIIAQVLGSVAELRQSVRECLYSKNGHVTTPASGRSAW